MAITDLQISEELMTNAPSIKYRGNEGPKSPEEERMMMVDDVLDEAYEQYIYDLLEQRPDATPMSKEEFRRMVIMEGMIGGGNPLPEDPTKPVNPFAPKPIGPVLPDKRQMAAFGGIMGMDGRRRYGIGSWFQENIMDPIKENPEIAAAAALYGIDTFGIPGTEIGGDKVVNKTIGNIYENPTVQDILYGKEIKTDKEPSSTDIGKTERSGGIVDSLIKNLIPIAGGAAAGLFTKNTESDTPGLPSDETAIKLADLKKTANILNQKQGLAAGLNFLPDVAARKFTPQEMIETYAQSAANGGRIRMAEGGIMDLGGLEKDYRNTGGFVEIGAKEKADDVPARLSVNEFVFTADAVRNAGGGDIDEGAKVMENVMKHLEGGGQLSRESQGMGGARNMFAVSERLSEVV